MKMHLRFSWAAPAAVVLGLVTLFGCMDDKPALPEHVYQPAPEITLGPFMTQSLDGSVSVRFHTNVDCTAGVSVKGSSYRVRRVGRTQRHHAVRIDGLNRTGRDRCRILLDDEKTEYIRLPRILGRTESVHLVFMGGTGQNNVLAMQEGAKCISQIGPEAIFIAGGVSQGGENQLAQGFFLPLAELLQQAPVYFTPDIQDALPRSIMPVSETPDFWSRDFGCIHVMSLNLSALRDYRQRRTILEKMQADLQARNPEQRWSVLMTHTPLFGSREINVRALEALGDLLDQYRVDLVISGDEGCYSRSLPLQTGAEPPIRYITVGGLGQMQQQTAGREYTAVLRAEPHMGILTATSESLRWRAVRIGQDMDVNQSLDELTLYSGGDTDLREPPLQKQSVLSGAQAKAVMRREVLTIARQAACAVADQTKPFTLPVVLANPSSEPVTGQVFWQVPNGSAWAIEPEGMEFSLGSGFEGKIEFEMQPSAAGGPMPTMVVNMKDVGSTRQPLFLTSLRECEIYPAGEDVNIDGLLTEEFWQNAGSFLGFETLGGGQAPVHPVEAKAAYNDTGLVVAVVCTFDKDNPPVTEPARKDDDPVYHDESVEVFLDPIGHGRDYFQFAVNASDIALDRSSRIGLAWTPRWKHAVRVNRRTGKYTVEMLIPYPVLGIGYVPTPGSSWRVNITRNDYSFRDSDENGAGQGAENKPLGVEVAQWSQTGSSNGFSGCYGVMKFAVPVENKPAPADLPAGAALAPAPAR